MSAPATAAAAAPPWQARLAAKRRRRVIVPIQVSEQAGDLAATAAKRRATLEMLGDLPTAEAAQLRAQAEVDLAAAEAALAEHVVELTFQSLPAHEYDALVALHPSTDPGDDHGINWRTALPALAAACCTENGGDDEAWWAEVLAMDSWTPADLLTLWGELLRLHTRAPSARLPFD